ncbi:MAG TPA: FKBP-type peptidyl-prolyl cis-trans isomerase [Ferruginibacter sp.]|nr:FKBP-type peptidyl-prolyl cis-trans isomerase [Ferruginibacter sp.]
MKKVLLSFVALLALAISVSAQKTTKTTAKPAAKSTVKNSANTPVFKNLIDSFSYAAGFNVATNMQAQGINKLNTAMMLKGLDDVFKKNEPLMTQEVINTCMQQQLEIFNKEKTVKELAEGNAFLETNKKRTGVITLPSGLQYEIIKNGDANSKMPKAIDTVVVNYIGKFIDGKEFENSIKSGKTAAFPLSNMIKGWVEVLQLMHIGDHWRTFIPSELAFGPNGSGQVIPPNAVLIFDIMLEDVRPAVAKTGN